MKKQKLIIVIGPTASGKSELAVFLAKKYNGEIISADSRQVYKGLDIGSAKVKGRWRHGLFVYKTIPHHCIDFASPKEMVSVTEFKQCAEAAIGQIARRGRIPIIAGGTGFWIDAVAHDMQFPEVPPNQTLRAKLEKKSPETLLNALKKLDPERARTIEQKNPRRLIRAIEIAEALGRVPRLEKRPRYDALWIGVRPEDAELKKRLQKRLAHWVREGFAEEGKRLRRQRLPWKRFYEFGFEYRFLADHLRGDLTASEMQEKIRKALWGYVKRQDAWFKKNRDIRWVKGREEAGALAKNFLGAEKNSKPKKPPV